MAEEDAENGGEEKERSRRRGPRDGKEEEEEGREEIRVEVVETCCWTLIKSSGCMKRVETIPAPNPQNA